MDRIEKSAIRQYIRQFVFLAMRGRTVEALELIYSTAKNDSDISKDGYDILTSLCDGVSDYREIQK